MLLIGFDVTATTEMVVAATWNRHRQNVIQEAQDVTPPDRMIAHRL